MIDFEKKITKANLNIFAQYILELQYKIGFKISARGWCYQLESERIINKDQFNKVESWINRCRKTGLLPIDFTAEEPSRSFDGVEEPTGWTPIEYFAQHLRMATKCGDYYTPDWWEDEEYYIQMIVEKIDLKTLFSPICEKYHIPIATSKGWSSMLQRAEYAKRFKDAEDRGLQSILLYCGDHDPDGLRISDFIRSNLLDLKDVVWDDGEEGYDPINLEINRFGLNYGFIIEHNLTWIDNLITGSGGYIAKNIGGKIVQGRSRSGKPHPNFHLEYAQEYLEKYGVRKCEANALVPMPEVARAYVENVIISYLGDNALERFSHKAEIVKDEINQYQQKVGIDKKIQEIVNDNL